MAQPSLLTRLIRYLDYQGAHPSAPFNGSDHDAEHDQIVTVVNQIRNNLGLIQRDDTALKNASVHPDSLSTATKALIAATWTPRGLWVTATAYVVGDMVQNSTTSYVCATAHTAGVFATDYAAGKWLILGETAAAGASAVSFSPAGGIAATDVQAAIEELDAEKAPKNGSASNLFSVNDATGANHAVAMQQIQKNSLVSASGAGTGDAITATLTSGLTALNDGMAVLIEAPGTNSTTTPTFNLTLGATATSAKTIVKGNNQALVAGDIASNKLHLVYDSSLDKWVLINPLFPVGQSTATTEADSIINLGITFSVGSSALLASIKTAAGANPTASDSVRVSMPSATLSAGQYAVRTITDSTCTLTVSSGSTLGHSSAVEGALHWYLIDNAGTLELAVSSKYFGASGIVSTTAEGGAGAADSATVMYSTAARSNVPFRWIGKTLDTQATAGTWGSVPTNVGLLLATVGTEQIDDAAVTVAKLDTDARSVTLPLNANPNMLIDQINEGGLYTAGGGVQMLDAWSGTIAGSSGVFKTRRLTAPWNAGESCMEITCTTADASVAAGDLAHAYTCVEGYDAAILNAGLADAGELTIQFKFKTSKTGVYGISVQNSTQDRSYIGTITVADTDVHDYAVTLTMDTSGTWLKTNGVGLYVSLTLMAGTTYQTTAAAWTAGSYFGDSSQVNFLDNVANIAYLGKFHIIKGGAALPFSPASYGDDLQKCQRYYEKTFSQGTPVAQNASTFTGSLLSIVPAGDTLIYFNFPFLAEKRTTPTITTYNPFAANNLARNWGNSADSVGINGYGAASTHSFAFYSGSGASQNPYGIHCTANARLT